MGEQAVAAVTPQVFVVDDDRAVLTALSRLLRSAGYSVRTFESSRAFLAEHDPAVPGCALLDVGMAEMDGLSLQDALAAQGAARQIIFVTGADDVHFGVRAIKAGAVDYLTKPVLDDDLIAAVETALKVDSVARRERATLAELERRYEQLTEREREVMAHVVRGRLNKQIANDLGIVEKTVKVHRARLMEKMQVRSVAALVPMAERLAAARHEVPVDMNLRRLA